MTMRTPCRLTCSFVVVGRMCSWWPRPPFSSSSPFSSWCLRYSVLLSRSVSPFNVSMGDFVCTHTGTPSPRARVCVSPSFLQAVECAGTLPLSPTRLLGLSGVARMSSAPCSALLGLSCRSETRDRIHITAKGHPIRTKRDVGVTLFFISWGWGGGNPAQPCVCMHEPCSTHSASLS